MKKASWEEPVSGYPMYVLRKKLKRLKRTFYVINKKSFPNLEEADREAETKLKDCQNELNADPLNTTLREREREAAQKYSNVHSAYMKFLKQKCKAH